jgi:SAM-dependent methyltransferase
MVNEWYVKENDWAMQQPAIFTKEKVRFSFLEARKIIQLIGGLEKGAAILDLCCGIGRHSVALAEDGYKITGVDITAPYLEQAKVNAQKRGVQIEFLQGDMRDFMRLAYFDLVVNLYTSFGYFEDKEDDYKVLQNVYASLKGGGYFVMEILGKEVIAATFMEEQLLEGDDWHVRSVSKILHNWGTIEFKRIITRNSEVSEFVTRHRLYAATEINDMLSSIGFKDICFYGDFSGAPYDHKAKSMIIVMKKNDSSNIKAFK